MFCVVRIAGEIVQQRAIGFRLIQQFSGNSPQSCRSARWKIECGRQFFEVGFLSVILKIVEADFDDVELHARRCILRTCAIHLGCVIPLVPFRFPLLGV